jgi:pancreatic triacylglycerol lipase
LPSGHKWALVNNDDGQLNLVDTNPIEIEPEPSFNANTDVFFVLFTRRNPTAGQRLGFDANAIRNSQWRAANGLRIQIHGFQNNHQSPVNSVMRQAFLARADHNVVVSEIKLSFL